MVSFEPKMKPFTTALCVLTVSMLHVNGVFTFLRLTENRCLVRDLPENALDGTWNIFYSSADFPQGPLEMQATDKNTVRVSAKKLCFTLTRKNSHTGLLKQVAKKVETFTKFNHWYIVGFEPDQYLTVAIVTLLRQKSYVILTKEQKCPPQAIDGLVCMLRSSQLLVDSWLVPRPTKNHMAQKTEPKDSIPEESKSEESKVNQI